MTAPSSPEAPWPVRTVARKIADWIGRLGEVWVEGQVAQLSRRGGAATVFLARPADRMMCSTNKLPIIARLR